MSRRAVRAGGWLLPGVLLALAGCAAVPERDSMRADSTPAEQTPTATAIAPDRIRHWPADAPAAVVIALHSFRDHAGAYASLGPWLAERGYSVHALDQRGHGASEPHGRWPGMQPVIEDVVAMVHAARAEDPDRPVFLMGESMGGSAALASLATYPELDVAGVIAVAPGLRGGIPARGFWDAAVRTGETLAGGLTLTIDPDYADSLDPAAVERFANDPQVIRRVRLDTYAGVVWLAQYATDYIHHVTVPVVYLWGEQDGTILKPSVCAAARAHPGHRAEVWTEPHWPHLLLHAPDWPTTATRLVDWMQRVTDDAPGPRVARAPAACD
ncbi:MULTISPECIES: alpha/beta fold hydrolase [unclassified Thioalkalivibrio]|uniref:alpha/beta fold hydrolase n=1 Tax=unclassified Thioalkalivibrio TaxID=2621013 RepID=UPI00036469DF|nr:MULTISPECIES: alpha/beta fold hydrolase [unclassified Thioalkalivibrio]